MFATPPVTYTVQAGDTLSSIASSHGITLAAIESANPIPNPNEIYAGQELQLPGQSQSPSSIQGAYQATSSADSQPTATRQPATSDGSGSLSDVPGVPSSFAACVAYTESTDLQNPAANGNAYGIIPASGYNVSGDSLAQQKQVFSELYAADGSSPWTADGCPQHLMGNSNGAAEQGTWHGSGS